MMVEDVFWLFVLIVVFTAVIGLVVDVLRPDRRLNKYWSRSCKGREWRRRFPDSPREDIRAFLEAFVDGFCFPSSHRLKFGPDDKVMDVYGTLYPSKYGVDAMELECFWINLEQLYGAEPPDFFTDDSTLGDIFETLRSNGDRNQA